MKVKREFERLQISKDCFFRTVDEYGDGNWETYLTFKREVGGSDERPEFEYTNIMIDPITAGQIVAYLQGAEYNGS